MPGRQAIRWRQWRYRQPQENLKDLPDYSEFAVIFPVPKRPWRAISLRFPSNVPDHVERRDFMQNAIRRAFWGKNGWKTSPMLASGFLFDSLAGLRRVRQRTVRRRFAC
jgi:hypothetical protein